MKKVDLCKNAGVYFRRFVYYNIDLRYHNVRRVAVISETYLSAQYLAKTRYFRNILISLAVFLL